MKKASLAIAAAAFATTSAMAADLPSRKDAPVYAPPPPAFSWTGLYVGVNIGGGWMNNFNRNGWGTTFNGVVWVPTPAVAGGSSGGGVVGGVQAGYNFQLTPMFVIGLETDFQGTSIKGGNGGGLGFGGVTRSVDDFGTVRGRVGVTLPGWSQLLVYGTGGFAYGDIRLNHGWLGNLHGSAIGWSAGGGLEYAILPNWSVKAEYLYTNLGTDTWGGANRAEHHVQVQTVRAGVNYRLNWGAAAPVMAGF